MRLPSSQTSPAVTTPLPQPVGLQLLSQPSPLVVLPSSQTSVPRIMLSPQIGVHELGLPGQSQPTSTWQLPSQPSPGDVSLSSHASAPATLPSPHTFAVVTVTVTRPTSVSPPASRTMYSKLAEPLKPVVGVNVTDVAVALTDPLIAFWTAMS